MDCRHSAAPTSTLALKLFFFVIMKEKNERVVVCKKIYLVGWRCAVENDKCWLEFMTLYTLLMQYCARKSRHFFFFFFFFSSLWLKKNEEKHVPAMIGVGRTVTLLALVDCPFNLFSPCFYHFIFFSVANVEDL